MPATAAIVKPVGPPVVVRKERRQPARAVRAGSIAVILQWPADGPPCTSTAARRSDARSRAGVCGALAVGSGCRQGRRVDRIERQRTRARAEAGGHHGRQVEVLLLVIDDVGLGPARSVVGLDLDHQIAVGVPGRGDLSAVGGLGVALRRRAGLESPRVAGLVGEQHRAVRSGAQDETRNRRALRIALARAGGAPRSAAAARLASGMTAVAVAASVVARIALVVRALGELGGELLVDGPGAE